MERERYKYIYENHKEFKMKPFKTWQDALIEFINLYGHNYKDSYNLTAEFEQMLTQNRIGTYFLKEQIK